MDPELRRYLRAVLVLLGALAVATVWLLVDAVGSLLPAAIVAVLAVVVAEALLGYVSLVDREGTSAGRDEQESTGPPDARSP